jgi:predicted amidophosphoribosyltransferase
MVCPNCGAVHSLSDNFCRRCGWNLSGANVPAVIEDRQRALVSYSAERAMALGSVATFAVGALAWLAKRWLARKVGESTASKLPAVVQALPSAARSTRQSISPVREQSSAHTRVESYVWFRRITTFRREQD